MNFFKTSIKTLAFKTFYSFLPWSSVLEKQLKSMKNEFLMIFSPYETLLFSTAIQSLGQAR